eukprot:12360-Heterococcus_DN1.PRE.1
MAKRLLLNALRTAFADYIVGLTDDKLRLGVWSGEIELHDLQVALHCSSELRQAETSDSLITAVRTIEYAQMLPCNTRCLATHDATIRTHNVQVNEAAVNQLQLPVRILHGTVRKFRVSIPWASLDRNPVKVEIDGVYLLLGPVSKEDWAADEVRSRRLKIKRGQ